jgi:nucleoid DNA-binding protein
MSATRADIVRALAEQMGETQRSTERRVLAMLEILTEALLSEGRVELRGFGSFEVREIKAHSTVLPATGETLRVKKSYTVDFKPSKKLKTSLRERAAR